MHSITGPAFLQRLPDRLETRCNGLWLHLRGLGASLASWTRRKHGGWLAGLGAFHHPGYNRPAAAPAERAMRAVLTRAETFLAMVAEPEKGGRAAHGATRDSRRWRSRRAGLAWRRMRSMRAWVDLLARDQRMKRRFAISANRLSPGVDRADGGAGASGAGVGLQLLDLDCGIANRSGSDGEGRQSVDFFPAPNRLAGYSEGSGNRGSWYQVSGTRY